MQPMVAKPVIVRAKRLYSPVGCNNSIGVHFKNTIRVKITEEISRNTPIIAKIFFIFILYSICSKKHFRSLIANTHFSVIIISQKKPCAYIPMQRASFLCVSRLPASRKKTINTQSVAENQSTDEFFISAIPASKDSIVKSLNSSSRSSV